MLQLENVKKSYVEPDGSELPILDVPSFELADGEQAVLIGRSGGGKTTLLHVIAGIAAADSGKILINGLDIMRLFEAGRDRFRAQNLGYVFQTFNLLQGFSALENVLLGMAFGDGFVKSLTHGGHFRKRATQLLDRVGLSHRLHHKPNALSVGEQQRVAVARALANKPKLLLADEPTANVDPGNQQQVIELIRGTCEEEKVALLMVTHSMEVANQFSRVDRLEEINRIHQTIPNPTTNS